MKDLAYLLPATLMDVNVERRRMPGERLSSSLYEMI